MSKRKGKKTGKSNFFLVFIPLFVIVFLDQLTKVLVRNRTIPFNIIRNTGSAFGLFKGFNLGLIFVSFAFIGLVIFLYDQIPQFKTLFFSVGLILGGVVGNLIDRIYLGHVIDFIDFGWWPAFNIADSAIITGAVIFLFVYLRFEHKEYVRLHKKVSKLKRKK